MTPDTAGAADLRQTWETMVQRDGRDYLEIREVDRIPSFLMSIVSDTDLWLFVGSNGGMTAGRTDPDHALFPYRTADRILDEPGAAGVSCQIRCEGVLWEPWSGVSPQPGITRTLRKHVTGSSVVFEEDHPALGLAIEWEIWCSERFGLVRRCRIRETLGLERQLSLLDGWRQLLPCGVTQEAYARYSYLVAAYMRHELASSGRLGIYTLNSGVTDRAEPSECLKAAAAWSVGLEDATPLLSMRQVDAWRRGGAVVAEDEVRGGFGAHLLAATLRLAPMECREWFVVADTGLDQASLVRLVSEMERPEVLRSALAADVELGARTLVRRIAGADALQQTADVKAGIHHFANVVFNCMRGGTLHHACAFPRSDFAAFLASRNRPLATRHAAWIERLPDPCGLDDLRSAAAACGDPQLRRLASQYLPLSFSRRHGDPSRPWNRFEIRIRNADGEPVYAYAGNWRDIFQNWEALAHSYPAALGAMIDIFLNASTADGYNAYRITRDGIDWEVLDPDDAWSHIGYWGDHQIIYLLRLLEADVRLHPGRLASHLGSRHYGHADVPYAIRGFADILADPKHSIDFDGDRHHRLVERAERIGGDGKLLTDPDGDPVLVTLAEKLLVPLMVKLGNLVPGGGIWLNTQRPEWNDANNALAGWGLSVVTVCHLRRHLVFLRGLFTAPGAPADLEMSVPVADYLDELAAILPGAEGQVGCDEERFALVERLGLACERHRRRIHGPEARESRVVAGGVVLGFLGRALAVIDATLAANRRDDGMWHSYNLLEVRGRRAVVHRLDLMLEGQVAVLGSGALEAGESVRLLEALRGSGLRRADQNSYLLYPDRQVPRFLERNRLPDDWRSRVPEVAARVDAGDRGLLRVDAGGHARFHPDLSNARDLSALLDRLASDAVWADVVPTSRDALLALWEDVFRHHSFTGRSGAMFAFEGLGSIYWHMVAKLLLAVQETHDAAAACGAPETSALASHYRDIRAGLGFCKDAATYGAFPTDPYSHSPAHAGAQQPGMTGQVKEEILSRMGELGVRIDDGRIAFEPRLLDPCEFIRHAHAFEVVEVSGASWTWQLPADSLAFTLFQVPVCYRIGEVASVTLHDKDGGSTTFVGSVLPAAESREWFSRTGRIRAVTVMLPGPVLPAPPIRP